MLLQSSKDLSGLFSKSLFLIPFDHGFTLKWYQWYSLMAHLWKAMWYRMISDWWRTNVWNNRSERNVFSTVISSHFLSFCYSIYFTCRRTCWLNFILLIFTNLTFNFSNALWILLSIDFLRLAINFIKLSLFSILRHLFITFHYQHSTTLILSENFDLCIAS